MNFSEAMHAVLDGQKVSNKELFGDGVFIALSYSGYEQTGNIPFLHDDQTWETKQPGNGVGCSFLPEMKHYTSDAWELVNE